MVSAFSGRRAASQLLGAPICAQCRRAFSSSPAVFSGHNRWSKIKHEKGAADKKKTAARSLFAKNLVLYTKLYGANPDLNPQLARVITEAKKSGMPKANIEHAIARGQGRSATGEKLETAMLEVLGPGSVAVIIDIECDNKQRAIKDLKVVVKKHLATVTPTTFLFTRLGRTSLRPKAAEGQDFDDMFMQAVEAGAEDVEQDDDGNVVVWTQPAATHQTAQALSVALDAEIVTSDIIWKPTADTVKLDDEAAAAQLGDFLAAVRDNDDVQAIYANPEKGQIPDEVWRSIDDNLD
ncbi:hypothetical protein JX265_013775 [Neoarthrinium moseri]|uniref:Uncharacterized protein n=1 Tax=Neoarthrinium moseri TaxID=1658444 RepID=A0A9P9W808_9PEZI|nr:uncharacterized protein JN550_013519 [Neoarthrinium moseri]KAI1844120.1 hypothetical protein JX266_009793 [Neoarthrinium moseri]KAI1848775.1 hypothetical protein JX265_013775 [Neoarthrinium moseri]KAI1856988.1 hypothetical protein JN550_013519 [Neoarthrinium moseri]